MTVYKNLFYMCIFAYKSKNRTVLHTTVCKKRFFLQLIAYLRDKIYKKQKKKYKFVKSIENSKI